MTEMLLLALSFFKIGLFTIGGGLAMLPLLQDEIDKNQWMSPQEFIEMVAISESTPGPIGVNMATYVGFQTAGVSGALLATAALAAPSVIIIILIAQVFHHFRDHAMVRNAFTALRPAVTGLIAAAAFTMARVALLDEAGFSASGDWLTLFNLRLIILATAVLLLARRQPQRHPIVYIALAAIIGMLIKA